MKKPLTRRMEDILMDCHERELMRMPPRDAALTPSVAGMVSRGVLYIKPYGSILGKWYLALYLTIKGKGYLINLMQSINPQA